MHSLIGHPRSREEFADRRDTSGAEACFLLQFTCGALNGRLRRLHRSSGQFPDPLLKGDSEIANQRDVGIVGHTKNDDGARVADHFPRGLRPVGKDLRHKLEIEASAAMQNGALARSGHRVDDRNVSGKRRKSGGRKPFNPKQMRVAESLFDAKSDDTPSEPAAPEKQAAASSPERYTVSQLAALIDHALKTSLPARVTVVGEVSGLKDQTHWYFRLKDAEAVVDCVMFASSVRKQKFTPRDGEEVAARGRIEHFARQGRTQLYADRIEPIGAGALELKFRELCDELRERGWFAIKRKRPLPRFPRRVAIVTSKTSAAVQDVLDTFRRRSPFIPLLVADVRVQGERAAPEIAAMLRRLSSEREALGLDAVILTRGGGSMEDLWAFNERVVAEAIVECSIPVVAAIGHETDTTIAELVADERAATPTQAAMRLSPDREALLEQVEQLRGRSQVSLARMLAHEQQRLRAVVRHAILSDPGAVVRESRSKLEATNNALGNAVTSRLHQSRLSLANTTSAFVRTRPEAVLADRAARVREAHRRLSGSLGALLERRRAELRERERTLEATGPVNVLRRGYSVTVRSDGRVVQSHTDVAPGELIETRLADGQIVSTVGDYAASAPDQHPVQDDDADLFENS